MWSLSVESKVWGVKCGVWSVMFKVWSVGCGVESVSGNCGV